MKFLVDEVKTRLYPGKKVGVLVEMSSKGQPSKVDLFEFELDRFKLTLDFIEQQKRFKLQSRTIKREELNVMAKENKIGNEVFRTILINYLCSYKSPKQIFNKLPNRSLGFVIQFDIDDYKDPMILALDYETLQLAVENFIERGLLNIA